MKLASVPSLIRSAGGAWPAVSPIRRHARPHSLVQRLGRQDGRQRRARRNARDRRHVTALTTREVDDQRRRRPAPRRKRRKPACADRGGGGVGQRMEVDRVGLAPAPRSSTKRTRRAGVVDQAEGGDRARRHAQRLLPSARSCRTTAAPSRSPRAGASGRSASRPAAEISHSWPLASFRNRFLVWPPGSAALISSPSPTRNTGGCSSVRVGDRRARPGRRSGRRGSSCARPIAAEPAAGRLYAAARAARGSGQSRPPREVAVHGTRVLSPPPPGRRRSCPAGRSAAGWTHFADRHPYRCLPLTMANTTGWEILCPVGFTAEWNGGMHAGRHHAPARPPVPGLPRVRQEPLHATAC